jgi:sortase A
MSAKKRVLVVTIAMLAFLLALLITLYPLISTWYNDRHQAQIHVQYKEELNQKDDSEIRNARKLAEAYNKAIAPGAQHTESFTQGALLLAAQNYDQLLNLAGNGIMGYVQIPSIDVDLPIYHGTEDATLEAGVGHLLGSSLPVGGSSTHCVLTAHSGMASQKLFSDLPQLAVGDVFYLEVLGEKLAYQVDQVKTVLPHDTSFLGITDGQDYCTLVTCTPFGINTHRLLVRGTRIPYEEAEQIVVDQTQKDPDPIVSNWEQDYLKGLYIGLALLAVIALLTILICILRRKMFLSKKQNS